MGASSVTGVGQGSADKAGQRGSEHLYVGVEKLIGTRVVESGYALTGAVSNSNDQTTGGGSTTAVVTLPVNLPGNWSSTFNETTGNVSPTTTVPPAVMDYAIFVSPYNSATATYVSSIGVNGASQQQFTITSGAGVWVFWQVVRISASSVTSFPTQY